MAQENAIVKLNSRVKTYLGPSKIHGIGVFALRDIAKGQKLYADHMPEVYSVQQGDFGKLFPEVREQIIAQWPLVLNGSKFAFPTCRVVAYMNHSDTPNYDSKNDVILKDIQKDEEITEDYRLIETYQQAFPWLTNNMTGGVV